MDLATIKKKIPAQLYESLEKEGIGELRPAQEKAVKAGLLEGKSLLVCTPTSSGKTLVAELGMLTTILSGKGKALYIVPLKALATEKQKEFTRKYGNTIKIAISIGDLDSSDTYLSDYDLIICTAEKLDSLLRHRAPWLSKVAIMVVDEIHLLNDPNRGPTLEIIITLLRTIIKDVQVLALSATIGNPKELASWLSAELVEDTWRPVKLAKGVYYDSQIVFED